MRTRNSDLGRRSPRGGRVRCREYVPVKKTQYLCPKGSYFCLHIDTSQSRVNQVLSIDSFIFVNCPVGWGCRIHRLHLCRGVRSPNECPGYDTKQSDGEVPAMPEFRECGVPLCCHCSQIHSGPYTSYGFHSFILFYFYSFTLNLNLILCFFYLFKHYL